MKAVIKFEWRDIHAPSKSNLDVQEILYQALWNAGYSITKENITIEGSYNEDKTQFYGKSGLKFPHDKIVWDTHSKMTS